MVCSQFYSQHRSRCLLSVAHQHRSWGSSNAEMRLLEVETGERDCKGNSLIGGNLKPVRENACSGYARTPSPIKSSWIQRLFPDHIARGAQPHLTKGLSVGREGFDELQAEFCHDTVFKSDVGNQSGFSRFEISRRSRQVLSSRHETLPKSNDTTCTRATTRISTSLKALPPRIQVSPRTLPVVEALLTSGYSKHAMEAQLSIETNKILDSSKFSGLANPIKRTVHFSADEKCRVSCSSIEGLSSRGARCVAGDFNASLLGGTCFNASQPTLEFSFNHPEAAWRSSKDSIYDCIQTQTYTYSGTELSNRREAGETKLSESGDPVSAMGLPSLEKRNNSDESRVLDRCLMPSNARAMASFPECLMVTDFSTTRAVVDLNFDRISTHIMNDRNHDFSHEPWEYGKGAIFSCEAPCGKGDAFTGGGCLNSGLGKYGSQCMSDLVSSQAEANIREKSISLAPCVVEQELGSSQGSHKEQAVTSGSFSFDCKSRLPHVSDDAEVAIERGHGPSCETSLHVEHSAQKGLPEDPTMRDEVEASRLGMPLSNVSSVQPELATTYLSKTQCPPFFRTITLMEHGRHLLDLKHDILPHKPTCMEIKGVYPGESNAEALYSHSVIQDAGIEEKKGLQLNGGIISSRLQSDSISKSVEGKEENYAHPSGSISRTSWEGFKSPLKMNALSVGTIESCSKRSGDLLTQGPGTNAETGGPSTCRGEHSHSFSVDRAVNKALDGPRSEGRGARWEVDVSVLRQNMWLKRWSITRPREKHSLPKVSSEERGIVSSRGFVENNHSSSPSRWEFSHHFDLRPAKRACYGQRSGLSYEPCQATPVRGSLAFGRDDQEGIDVSSHFMKRFLTPSATAMAVMGMTARKEHAAQPHRRGLFGVWPMISSTSKPLKGQVTIENEFLTRQKKDLHFSVKPVSSQVDA